MQSERKERFTGSHQATRDLVCYLGELLENNVVRISSKELSKRMKVTASQIRQDLNNFGGFGQQGYGYNVEYLHEEIGKILGLDTTQNMIIIGAGNLDRRWQITILSISAFGSRVFLILIRDWKDFRSAAWRYA